MEKQTNLSSDLGAETSAASIPEATINPGNMHLHPVAEMFQDKAESPANPLQGQNEGELDPVDEYLTFDTFEEAYAFHEAEADVHGDLEEAASD